MSANVDVSFVPDVDGAVVIEDALRLIDSLSSKENRTIVVLDEFQTIMEFEKGLDKKLRSVMQELTNVNFVILGSQESMMADIFEKKKSPFYHFGNLIRLKRIPYEDFEEFIEQRLQSVVSDAKTRTQVARNILNFTHCHPYYTQQLAAEIWQLLRFGEERDAGTVMNTAVDQIKSNHDIDYERLWLKFSLTERKILATLARNEKVANIVGQRTSTTYSAISKLVRGGYVVKDGGFSLEDPFFAIWIANQNRSNG